MTLEQAKQVIFGTEEYAARAEEDNVNDVAYHIVMWGWKKRKRSRKPRAKRLALAVLTVMAGGELNMSQTTARVVCDNYATIMQLPSWIKETAMEAAHNKVRALRDLRE